MSNQKIIIPPNFVEIKYHRMSPAKKLVEQDPKFVSPFSNPNADYILNISPQKLIDSIATNGGTFNFLNITGNLTINVENAHLFQMQLHPAGSYYLLSYPGSDMLKSKKLTISSKRNVALSLYSWRETPLPTQEIEISCHNIQLTIDSAPNLKKIKLITDKTFQPEIRISDAPILEELDISTLHKIETNWCDLSGVNPNCILKLHPELNLQFSTSSPIKTCTIGRMFGITKQDYTDDYEPELITNILNLPPQTKPIEIKLIDLQKAISEYTINKVSHSLQNDINKLRENIKKQEKYASLSPTEAKKQKLIDEGLLK